jgi:hypothetical protein
MAGGQGNLAKVCPTAHFRSFLASARLTPLLAGYEQAGIRAVQAGQSTQTAQQQVVTKGRESWLMAIGLTLIKSALKP